MSNTFISTMDLKLFMFVHYMWVRFFFIGFAKKSGESQQDKLRTIGQIGFCFFKKNLFW